MTQLSRMIAQVWQQISAAEMHSKGCGLRFVLETLAFRDMGQRLHF